MRVRSVAQIAIALCALSSLATLSQPARAAQRAGFVYVATNQPSGNVVLQYSRNADGSLVPASSAATTGAGGTGNGVGNLDPLGSQDSLVLSPDGSRVLVVNAGSNQISSLAAGSAGLKLLSTVRSNGSFPNSIALNGNLVYVLNAHTPNISGFRLTTTGQLVAIPGSSRKLPGWNVSKPHDVRFSPDGSRLIVTDEGTNQLDVFFLNPVGVPARVVTTPSAGTGPFGMRFSGGSILLNVEASSASASSYLLVRDGALTVISSAVPNGQAATCWVSVTADNTVAFVSNTGSGTLSSYDIGGGGTLSLDQAVAGTADGGAPIDSALSTDSAFLYVDDTALGRILIYHVSGANLAFVGAVTGLPQTLQGIAAQ